MTAVNHGLAMIMRGLLDMRSGLLGSGFGLEVLGGFLANLTRVVLLLKQFLLASYVMSDKFGEGLTVALGGLQTRSRKVS